MPHLPDNIKTVLLCASSAAMEELVTELRLFLGLLDREYLSAGVREKKAHLSNILHRVLADKGGVKCQDTPENLKQGLSLSDTLERKYLSCYISGYVFFFFKPHLNIDFFHSGTFCV